MYFPKLLKHQHRKTALPPGTLVHVGEKPDAPVRLSLIEYDAAAFHETLPATVDDCLAGRDSPGVTWIDIDGIHDLDLVAKIGQAFDLHPLTLEDIVHTEQRPKLESHDAYLYLVFHMIAYREEQDEIAMEQVSLVVGERYVISFQERAGDLFEPVRERVRQGKGRIRKCGADYLAYALLDAVVDHYFVILEKLGEKIEQLEESLAAQPGTGSLQTLRDIKRTTTFLRKAIWPLRELIAGFQREGGPIVSDRTQPYLRDLYDHTIRVMDTIETYRDLVAGMFELHMSSVSNRMNEVMKTLTIIATIFIPLTFIAGVYGMNFSHMPELSWSWGYFVTLGVMGLIFLLMILYFRKKNWL